MPGKRAAAILPPQHQLQRLQEWLRVRLAAERVWPPRPDHKERLKRGLGKVEDRARKLAELLEDELGQAVLHELYVRGSDMRLSLLRELADQAAALQAIAREDRKEPLPVQAARLFLYLLKVNGSSLPAMTGGSWPDGSDYASDEVACFHRLLVAAGHPCQIEAARQNLSRRMADFDPHAVPAVVLEWAGLAQKPADSCS